MFERERFVMGKKNVLAATGLFYAARSTPHYHIVPYAYGLWMLWLLHSNSNVSDIHMRFCLLQMNVRPHRVG